FYYLVLRNTDRPLAGASTALLRAASRLAAETDAFEIALSGDGVTRAERLGANLRIDPLPPKENREQFLAGFDIVVFASHLGFFDGLAKPEGGKWALWQHCWELMPDIPPSLGSFDLIVASSAIHKDNLVKLGCAGERVRVAGRNQPAGFI
ncbi:MAG: hypothetical protein HQK82_15550, partial [Desulfovibrionaceae bacterium]|nr:hypothetical protein [Desulfovibrionaceae bacterium]